MKTYLVKGTAVLRIPVILEVEATDRDDALEQAVIMDFFDGLDFNMTESEELDVDSVEEKK